MVGVIQTRNRSQGILHFHPNRVAEVQRLIDRNITQLIPCKAAQEFTNHGQVVVFFTGSTGALGSHLLKYLINDFRVHKIYTHNRSGLKTVSERQAASFRELGLDEAVLSSAKLTSLQGDLVDDHLGLEPSVYSELLNSVTTIIHNAWTLDFKSPVSHFEPLIDGSLGLINFTRRLYNPLPRFLFSSSITALQNFGSVGEVSEAIVLDPTVSLGPGYGESKYIVERILAASEGEVNGCCVRLPQLYGGKPRGIWPASGWLPIVVKSSLTLGQLPNPHGMVEWLSVDDAARVMRDLALCDCKLPPAINLSHPNPVEFAAVMSWMREALESRIEGIALHALAPLGIWLDNLRRLGRSGTPIRDLPALKIEPFIQNIIDREERMNTVPIAGALPVLSTTLTHSFSPSLNDSEALTQSSVERWVNYWIESGFLKAKGHVTARL